MRASRSRRAPSAESIIAAIADRSFSTIGWRLLQFDSGDQTPGDKIGWNGIHGNPGNVHLGDESIRVRDLLQTRLQAPGPANTIWTWLTRTQGIDVTAMFDNMGNCVGASIGFLHSDRLWPGDHIRATYLTLLTAVTRDAPRGVGTSLRLHQIDRVNRRLGREPAQEDYPIQLVSYSALPTAEGRGAVGFQDNVFLTKLEWTQGSTAAAQRVLDRLEELYPQLHLAGVRDQPVQAMRFTDD